MDKKVLIYDIGQGTKTALPPNIQNATYLSEIIATNDFKNQYSVYTEAIFEIFPSSIEIENPSWTYFLFRACLKLDENTKIWVPKNQKNQILRKLGLYGQTDVFIGKYGDKFVPYNGMRKGSDRRQKNDWID